jgi:hypothetical protein
MAGFQLVTHSGSYSVRHQSADVGTALRVWPSQRDVSQSERAVNAAVARQVRKCKTFKYELVP